MAQQTAVEWLVANLLSLTMSLEKHSIDTSIHLI